MNDHTDTPTAIRLLILSSSFDHTERITTFLRNGGMAVHVTRLHEMEDVEEKLRTEEYDIVLCCAFDEKIDLQQTLDLFAELEKDLPLLIMSDETADPVQLLQAMRDGARDLVDKEDLEHMQLVVAREFDGLQQRRELAEAKQRLQESEERAMGLIESSREAIAFIQEGIHVRVNPAYLEVFGFESREDLEDLPLLDVIDKGSHKELRATLKKLKRNNGKNQGAVLDAQCQRQDDSKVKAKLHFSKATMDGDPCLQVIVRRDEATSKEMQKKLRRLRQMDADTRLPNRQYFQAKMVHWVEEAAAETEQTSALVYLAIDHIPKLRTSLGMARIDTLVKDVAKLLRGEIDKEHDLLARFTATTFTLLCRRTSTPEVEKLAEAMRAKVDSTHYPDIDPDLGPSCSIGVTVVDSTTDNVQDIIDEAYNASEIARKQGGNRIHWPREEAAPAEPGTEVNETIQQIEDALQQDRFRLAFQPIVSLQGDTRENYAVLVRMLNENDEELLPEHFMELAERHGKMVEIDRWIIRNAISALAEQRKDGHKINLFVTLSEPSLQDKNTLLWICDCLREYDARGGWLTFQINEQYARANMRRVTKLIDGLRKIRCQIAVDHYGLLPNPEMVLENLEIDFIKFAPSFVEALNTNEEKQETLTNLNKLAGNHDIKTVATAVEDANSLTKLWTVGVGYIQGYFVQEPSQTIEYGSQNML